MFLVGSTSGGGAWQYRPLNAIILMIGTPEMTFLIYGNPKGAQVAIRVAIFSI